MSRLFLKVFAQLVVQVLFVEITGGKLFLAIGSESFVVVPSARQARHSNGSHNTHPWVGSGYNLAGCGHRVVAAASQEYAQHTRIHRPHWQAGCGRGCDRVWQGEQKNELREFAVGPGFQFLEPARARVETSQTRTCGKGAVHGCQQDAAGNASVGRLRMRTRYDTTASLVARVRAQRTQICAVKALSAGHRPAAYHALACAESIGRAAFFAAAAFFGLRRSSLVAAG